MNNCCEAHWISGTCMYEYALNEDDSLERRIDESTLSHLIWNSLHIWLFTPASTGCASHQAPEIWLRAVNVEVSFVQHRLVDYTRLPSYSNSQREFSTGKNV